VIIMASGAPYILGVANGLILGTILLGLSQPKADLGPVLKLMCENPAARLDIASLKLPVGEQQVVYVGKSEIRKDGSFPSLWVEGAKQPVLVSEKITVPMGDATYTVEGSTGGNGEVQIDIGRRCEGG
jgi:hypothetical protein